MLTPSEWNRTRLHAFRTLFLLKARVLDVHRSLIEEPCHWWPIGRTPNRRRLYPRNWVDPRQRPQVVSGSVAQDFLDVANRENVEKLCDMCPQRQLGTFVFVEFRDVSDRLLRFLS